MKANKAPEKIYMTPSFGEPDNVLLASFSKSHLDFHRDIEYTRTDAFIEKAVEWIENNINEYTDGEDIQFTSENTFNIDIFNQAMFIDDFKNYMKGE